MSTYYTQQQQKCQALTVSGLETITAIKGVTVREDVLQMDTQWEHSKSKVHQKQSTTSSSVHKHLAIESFQMSLSGYTRSQ